MKTSVCRTLQDSIGHGRIETSQHSTAQRTTAGRTVMRSTLAVRYISHQYSADDSVPVGDIPPSIIRHLDMHMHRYRTTTGISVDKE